MRTRSGFRGDHAHNLPLRRKMRVRQRRIHGFKPRIAVGSVDPGVEARAERERVTKVREPEVGYIRLPIHSQVAQRALVVPGGS